jgi:hypothetical protein
MDRNATPSKSSIVLSDSEFAKRAAPGRLAAGVLKTNDHRGGSDWTPVGSGSPAAIAGQAEHEIRRARPDLVAKRASKGK